MKFFQLFQLFLAFQLVTKDLQQTHLNKISCLAPALGVTKVTIVKDTILVTLCCDTQVRLRCSANQPLYCSEASLWNKSSYLAPDLGVTKVIIVKDTILVTLCCDI